MQQAVREGETEARPARLVQCDPPRAENPPPKNLPYAPVDAPLPESQPLGKQGLIPAGLAGVWLLAARW